MIGVLMAALLALLAAPEQLPAVPSAPFTYRFEEVKGRVYRYPQGDEKRELRAEAGQTPDAGDHVRTNWRGKAVVTVPERGSRFEIAASTRVRLASREPGVLLVVDRGKVKAVFDALTGAEPVERRVGVPGALLAVRGTRYGVEVDASGQSGLAVFEGTVEVIPAAPGTAPFKVTKNQFCVLKPGAAPRVMPMGPTGMNESSWGSRSGAGMGDRPGAGANAPGMNPGGPGAAGGPMHGGPKGH